MFWIRPHSSAVAELGHYPHPYVVVQEDIFNHSRISTVVVCALTSNLKQAGMPGNVLLEAGEAGLPRQSVVDVAKVSSVQKAQLGACIGTLVEQRIQQILRGIRFLQLSAFTR
jgi:mRNA interferase MazF